MYRPAQSSYRTFQITNGFEMREWWAVAIIVGDE